MNQEKRKIKFLKQIQTQIKSIKILSFKNSFCSLLAGLLLGSYKSFDQDSFDFIIEIIQYIQILFEKGIINKTQRIKIYLMILNLQKNDAIMFFREISQRINIQSIEDPSQVINQLQLEFFHKNDKSQQNCRKIRQQQDSKIIEQIKNTDFQIKSNQQSKTQPIMQINNNCDYMKQSWYQQQLKLIQEKQKYNNESQQLAKKLMEQQQTQAKRIREKEAAICQMCFDDLQGSIFFYLDCLHPFHRQCLQQYYTILIQQRKFPLICPKNQCKTQISINDIKQLLNQQLREKYYQFTLNNYVDNNGDSVSWCPTADCKFCFFFQEGQFQFQCPQCKKKYCLKCRAQWHKEMTCQQFEESKDQNKNEIKFKDFVRGSKFKQCPKCKFWVTKQMGCDSMTCRCGTFFCYKCGQQQQFDHGPCKCTNNQNIFAIPPIQLIPDPRPKNRRTKRKV